MTIPSTMIEKGARALMQAECGGPLGHFASGAPMRQASWNDYDDAQHDDWRRMARAAFEVAGIGELLEAAEAYLERGDRFGPAARGKLSAAVEKAKGGGR